MTDYYLKPHKIPFKEEVIIIDPKKAFELFVAPRLADNNWIEDSRNVTDTNMSSREWAGLALYAMSLTQITGDKLQVGKDSRNGDGVIVQVIKDDRYNGLFVEQTLVTHRAKHEDIMSGIKERIFAKSDRGDEYVGKQHLILWCNIAGDIDVDSVAEMVKENRFLWVVVMGFSKQEEGFTNIVFSKKDGMVDHYFYKFEDLITA